MNSDDTTPIPFPLPESVSARAYASPPSVPPYVAGVTSRDHIIAVPVLLMIPTGKGAGVVSDIGDAVSIVRTSEVRLGEVLTECVCLSNADGLHTLPQPATRARFFSLMSEAIASAKDSMEGEGGHDPEEIEEITSEAREVLRLLNAAGEPSEAVAP